MNETIRSHIKNHKDLGRYLSPDQVQALYACKLALRVIKNRCRACKDDEELGSDCIIELENAINLIQGDK